MKKTASPLFVILLLASLCCAEEEFKTRRDRLVRHHVERNGVKNERVIAAMRATLRHEFVPESERRRAYRDMALPIGFGQTISSPYIVARMTEQLDPQSTDRVLEIGTGSGYQAAVLSPLVRDVFTIEIVPELGKTAAATLKRLGYTNVKPRIGDGYKGWAEHAPFQKVIVTCSPENIPQPLIDQLAEGGHLVIPVGERFQQVLYRFTKTNGKLKRERIESTFFVPMTGVAESKRKLHSDDSTPQLINGGFEDRTVAGDPLGWYYVRGGKVVDNPKSPQGVRCLEVSKTESERAHAIQPVGIDGAKFDSLYVQFASKGQGIQRDILSRDSAQLVIEFYDEARRLCGDVKVAVSGGRFDWKQHEVEFDVPTAAKLAMVEVGLFGATGTIEFDDVKIAVKAKQSSEQRSAELTSD